MMTRKVFWASLACVAANVMVMGVAGCGAKSCNEEQSPNGTSASRAAPSAAAVGCPIIETKGTRPQSASYQGKCMDAARWFTLADGGPLEVKNGDVAIDAALLHHSKTSALVKVEQQANYNKISRVRNLRLYKVTHVGSGKNMCEGQDYRATQSDVSEFCKGDSACQEIKDLSERAMIVPGYWDKTNARWSRTDTSGNHVFSFSCTSGVEAKCIMWGYTPWVPELEPYFKACVNAARAHYLPTPTTPDDRNKDSYTCQNTDIDIYDNFKTGGSVGLQRRDSNLEFESLWRADGTPYCIRHARYAGCSEIERMVDAGCKDPEPDIDGGWSAPDEVILAVASKDKVDAGVCPNVSEELNPDHHCPK